MVREYTAEFKLEAVKLANEQRNPSYGLENR